MIKPKSLQQRLAVFLLLPVAALLSAVGIVGFVYARNSLLDEWREATVVKLQRAAHDIDMRLRAPKQWMLMFNNTGGEHYDVHTQQWILEQLRQSAGIEQVKLVREDQQGGEMFHMGGESHMMSEMHQHMMSGEGGMMHFHRARIAKITPPRYDSVLERETVSIMSSLIDADGRKIGRLEVVVSFNYLMEHCLTSDWWRKHRGFLLDENGAVLASTFPGARQHFGDKNSQLELATLRMMREKASGTIIGKGYPPKEVSGFYRLEEAPWTLVMIAPGGQVLAPIERFLSIYGVIVVLLIVSIVILIQQVTGRTVSSIRDVSEAADNIARGDYTAIHPTKSEDEVGHLIRSFNTMVSQLQERMKLKQELNLAMEVQQSLLPQRPPRIGGFDIAGKSIYCEETGGDYYDFIEFPELGQGHMGVAVGDVAGHGIAPALLMTTVRAFLRSRVLTEPEDLADAITDVNRLLCLDSAESGNFMTLFFMLIDSRNGKVRWVRAGHEPAMVYDPGTDSFDELLGRGIALGVDETWAFEEEVRELWSNSQIVLIGTDGIWESENLRGESFGKERLKEIIRQQKNKSSEEIVRAITEALADHRQTAPQQDDVTMVVIKKV